jgi:ribosomal protein L29
MNMKFEELKKMDPSEVKSHEEQLRKELFDLRSGLKTGSIKDRSDLANKTRSRKKDIARIQTLITQQKAAK